MSGSELYELISSAPLDVLKIRALIAAHPHAVVHRPEHDSCWPILYYLLADTERISDLIQLVVSALPQGARDQVISYEGINTSYLRMRDGIVTDPVLVSDEQALLLLNYGAKFANVDACPPKKHESVQNHYRHVLRRRSALVALFVALHRHKGVPRDVARLIVRQDMPIDAWAAKRAKISRK